MKFKFEPYRLILAAFMLVCAAGTAAAVVISTHSPAGCVFPGTNQWQSYTTTFGEDHDYASSVSKMSFTTYNGLVWGGTATSLVTVDNRTGLMWVTNMVDAGVPNTSSSTWEGAITLCEGLNYAGFTDWRLPNIRELVSIVDFSLYSPAINTNYFLNTHNTSLDYYWSSSTASNSISNAFFIKFYDGLTSNSGGKSVSNYVICVRGGP